MPQIIVDTATESPASLVLVSRLLQDYAVLKAKDEQQAAHEYPVRNGPADANGQVSTLEVTLPASPVPAVLMPTVAAAPAVEQDPAKLFAKPTPVPVVAPAAPSADVSGAGTSSKTTAPLTAPVSAPEVPSGTELDTAGVRWDARIHSSAKGVKKDGTWKLARNVDPALVTMVLHEITPKPHVAGGMAPVGTANVSVVQPVTVPVPVPTPVAIVPSAAPDTSAPVPPVPVPVPPAPGAVPDAPLNPVQQFQAIMLQITAAQNAGTLTHTNVLDAVKAEGVAQLQLLIMHPDKIPAVKARLGLV